MVKKLVLLFCLLVFLAIVGRNAEPLHRSKPKRQEVAVASDLETPALDLFIRAVREWGKVKLRDPDGADYDFSSSKIERELEGSGALWRFRFRVNARNGYGGLVGWQERTLRILDDGRYIVQ